MSRQKINTKYPGVRYYEHATRKQQNGQADRYFSIRYRLDGKLVEEGLGWATEGWNAGKCNAVLGSLKEAKKTGKGPRSLREAREAAAMERAKQDEQVRREALAEMSLGAFLDQYYMPVARREKRSWLTDEQRIAKAIKPQLGHLPLAVISKADVQAFVDTLVTDGAAPSTIKQYASIVRRAFTLAAETHIDGQQLFTGDNPASRVRIPDVRNRRERFLTAREAKSLIKAAGAQANPDLHDMIVLSLNTGLRLGELLRLHWADVDLVSGFVTVRDENHRKPGGSVPLNADAAGIFKLRTANGEPSGLVFPAVGGEGARIDVSHQFRAVADELGLNAGIAPEDRQRRVVFHTLRHTFASWLALNGTDIFRIKTLMRHKTIEMTLRYAHLIPDATREAVHNLKPPKGS